LASAASSHVDLVERRRLAGDALDPAHGFDLAVDEVVDDHDVVAVVEQLDGGVRADVARTAGDEDGAFSGHC
jgi:hypothetical protein